MTTTPLFQSHLLNLSLIQRGKVRDIYAVDDKHLLIVATDRLSAFDGELLSKWFPIFGLILPNLWCLIISPV